MAARSPTFEVMLRETPPSGDKIPVIAVTNCSSAVLESVIKFAYTDLVSSNKVSIDLLKAAHHFEMINLFKACEVYLAKTIRNFNAIEIYLAAHECEASQLIGAAGRAIIDKFYGRRDCPEFLSLFQDHPKEAAHLLYLDREQVDGRKKADL